MTWLEHHHQSEKLASSADVARFNGDGELAKRLYGKAAEAEVRAIDALDPSKVRTLGITAVSAVALYYKAAQLLLAESTAYRFLGLDNLPNFARLQLRDLLHAIWAEQRDVSEVAELPSDQLNVAMSGNDILMGVAPIGAVVRCVEAVQSLLYRVAEFIQGVDHRPTGRPSPAIRAACRPSILHVPASNYQFAVTIEDSIGQRELFDDRGPHKIVDTAIDILRAGADSPEEELPMVVPADDYQHTFLQLTRDLSPNEPHRLSVWSPRHPKHISLDHTTRERARAAMSNTIQKPMGPRSLEGVLRAVDLDRGRIMVKDQHGKYKVDGIDDTLDDSIGAMVNRPVVVQAEASATKLIYKNIAAVDSKESGVSEQELDL